MKLKTISAAATLGLFMGLSFNSIGQDKQSEASQKTTMLSPYESDNILGFSGMDMGARIGRYNIIPRDPYTGRSLLSSVVTESPDKPIQKVDMYSVNFTIYGSFIGRMLLKKKDRRLVVADISEMGVDLAGATESGRQYSGEPISSFWGKTGNNHTVASLVNIATGVLVAYRIDDNMRATLRYQYFIDQGVVFYSWLGLDHTSNFDFSSKRVTGTFAYKEYMAEANLYIPWKYGDDTHGNRGWGLGLRKRVGGNNRHLGLKFNVIYQRKSPEWGTRNWHDIMFYYGVGI